MPDRSDLTRTPAAPLVGLALLFACSTGCGWFAGGDDDAVYIDPALGNEAAEPACRPAALDARGPAPYAVGDTTPSGWAVTAVDSSHEEYVRVKLTKGEITTEIELAINSDGPGDWATEHYKLMPAPEAEPPEELLLDAIARLREHAAAETGPSFVKRTEGVEDPFEGLPPCPPE